MGMPREHGFAKKLQNIPEPAFQRIKGKKKNQPKITKKKNLHGLLKEIKT